MEELFNFLNEVYNDHTVNGSLRIKARQLFDKLKNSNNSRRSERRAIGSNSKSKEVCGSINFCRYQDEDGFCESKYNCHLRRKQTD